MSVAGRRVWHPFREPLPGEVCVECRALLVAAWDDSICHCQWCDRLFCGVECIVLWHLRVYSRVCES